ncbi:MAG: replicative DNA helicase [Synergistaceae bacterium]|nr:replicative DNA helicase [Synergistaceae bacterium]
MNVDLTYRPSNPEAERAVIGAAILSKEALGSAIEILKPDDFADANNRMAFEVLLEMYSSNVAVDLVTFSEALKARGIFERLGGQPYFAELVSVLTTTANVGYHADIIREHAVRRRLIDAGEKIIALSQRTDKTTKDIIEEIERLIYEASQNKSSSEFRHVRELIAPTFVHIEDNYKNQGAKTSGYPTGFYDIDNYTGGLQNGSLIIIAARPSMGKTAFALNIAQFGGTEKNLPVLIFSLEMPADQLVLRMLAAESEQNLSELNKGDFKTDTFEAVRKACDVVARKNIYINDDSNLTAIDFRTRCRRFKTQHPDLGLIIVDYLQLMSVGGPGGRTDGRQQEVADISRMLKGVARELNCPVIALSQLSRAAEQRNEKKPMLSDLRDSGAIEQDADIVMLMFREDYYKTGEPEEEQSNKAEIRIAKNRNGSTGTVQLDFWRECTRFVNPGTNPPKEF